MSMHVHRAVPSVENRQTAVRHPMAARNQARRVSGICPQRLAQAVGADDQPSNLFRDFDCDGPPGLLLLRNPDGGPLCDSFIHLIGAEHWPDRHAGEPCGIGTQLGGCCNDFIGVVDNRVNTAPKREDAIDHSPARASAVRRSSRRSPAGSFLSSGSVT